MFFKVRLFVMTTELGRQSAKIVDHMSQIATVRIAFLTQDFFRANALQIIRNNIIVLLFTVEIGLTLSTRKSRKSLSSKHKIVHLNMMQSFNKN